MQIADVGVNPEMLSLGCKSSCIRHSCILLSIAEISPALPPCSYLFTYLDASPSRPSLEALLSEYWRRMPEYQGVQLEDLQASSGSCSTLLVDVTALCTGLGCHMQHAEGPETLRTCRQAFLHRTEQPAVPAFPTTWYCSSPWLGSQLWR